MKRVIKQEGKYVFMTEVIITQKLVHNIIEKRKSDIHKGDCGRILIVAGSTGMAGAAILCAKAAMRAGSGLVQVAIQRELFPILQIGIPEATCVVRDFSQIDLDRYDAVAIGPGLGESEQSYLDVKRIITQFNGPLVLDADALNIVAHKDLLESLKGRDAGTTVITPHIGEAGRLLGETITDRQTAAKKLWKKTGAITVIKGKETLVITDQEKIYRNTTGNPGMATAGSGDVLTGIIVGLMGQKKPCGKRISPSEAALCGVFLHGMAGDLAAYKLGEYGLMAGDIAEYTAVALKKIIEEPK